MEENLKQLLLRDLCARLPYGVKVTWDGRYSLTVTPHIYCAILSEDNINNLPKLLLRPLSSMTDEEKGELKLEQEKDEELFIQVINKSQNGDDSLLGTVIPHCAEDWANKNHFDYRGLIEKGLALEAPKDMYQQNLYNMNIQEDFVSFETAKLLKDLGFEQNYYWHPVWWMNGKHPQLSFEGDDDFPYSDNVCCGCTQAEALKFLRENRRLNIEILIAGLVERSDIPVEWKYRIYDSANNIDYGCGTTFDTYEEACEAAIKYCLEHLI